MTLRWDPCVVQDAPDFDSFLVGFIDRADRSCLIIGGAGFDPRSTLVPQKFSRLSKAQIEGIFFREERLLDQPFLRPCADKNESAIKALIPKSKFPKINIFSDGVTAVGGRNAVEAIAALNYNSFSDVFVDISALSCGVFFSIVSFLVGQCDKDKDSCPNLHLLTLEHPQVDHNIRGVPADTAAMLHWIQRKRDHSNGSESLPLLWIPTLSLGNRDSLSKIYQFIQRTDTPIDVCPVIPFPGIDPRLPDRLIEEYSDQLSTWRVDHRNFIYAAESDPLDSYRAILSLYATRTGIFRHLGGSQVVLSPLGNKMLSVGAMLAAIEKGLPVAMVESIGYEDGPAFKSECKESALKHVWLCGEACAK